MDSIGGQALIEGVLMKSPTHIGIAVRNQNSEIIVKREPYKSLTKKYKVLSIPFIRGSIVLGETMISGLKALNYSSDIAMQKDGEEESSFLSLFCTMLLSIAVALLVFKLLPLGITQLVANANALFENRFIFNLSEGVIKIGILIGYVYAISFIPIFRRVFQYHGAEHIVVNAHEHNDLDNVRKYSTVHVRCGTSFILFVLGISILVYVFLPTEISFVSKYGLRILLLPLIAGIAYELIRISPKYEKNILFQIFISPGLLVQKITTKKPDEAQIEVAKAALKAAL